MTERRFAWRICVMWETDAHVWCNEKNLCLQETIDKNICVCAMDGEEWMNTKGMEGNDGYKRAVV